MGDKLTSELAQRALCEAIDWRNSTSGLIAHSDRGKEYYAGAYQAILSSGCFICSIPSSGTEVSRKDNCYNNAVA